MALNDTDIIGLKCRELTLFRARRAAKPTHAIGHVAPTPWSVKGLTLRRFTVYWVSVRVRVRCKSGMRIIKRVRIRVRARVRVSVGRGHN
jgi:hypothetical protein